MCQKNHNDDIGMDELDTFDIPQRDDPLFVLVLYTEQMLVGENDVFGTHFEVEIVPEMEMRGRWEVVRERDLQIQKFLERAKVMSKKNDNQKNKSKKEKTHKYTHTHTHHSLRYFPSSSVYSTSCPSALR